MRHVILPSDPDVPERRLFGVKNVASSWLTIFCGQALDIEVADVEMVGDGRRLLGDIGVYK
jgi:hypothetical protein